MISNTVAFIILVGLLFLLPIISYFFNILLLSQIYEMVISTLLLFFLLYIFGFIFRPDNRLLLATILTPAYLIWYFLTYMTTNFLNKDNMGVIRQTN